MAKTETKKWWKSKALWGAILTFASGGLSALGYPEAANLLITTGLALGITGLRLGTTKLN